MATCQISRSSVPLGMVLLVVTAQVMCTDGLLWFRTAEKARPYEQNGQQGARDSNSKKGLQQLSAFDIETPAILGEGGRGKQIFENSNVLKSVDSCWQEAYSSLESSCREILNDDGKKSRLALRLTDCFLKTSGRPQLRKCADGRPIATCLKDLDDHNHAIFLSFFLDSSTMCHYLQSQEFKIETEKLVNELKLSAHYTENKLGFMNEQLEKSLHQSEKILDIQNKLEMAHAFLQENIEEGMENLQGVADEVKEQLHLVNKYHKAIVEKQQELAESLTSEFHDLQRKSNQLGGSMTNLHGSVEELTQKSMAGQEEAMKGLTELQQLQLDAMKESKTSVNALVKEAKRHQEDFESWQVELEEMHSRLVEGSTNMIKTQEIFVTRQAAVFSTLEKLFSLHNSILIESRAVKSVMMYFGLSVFVYMATTTKQTRSARALLYFGLFLTFTCEIWFIRFGMDKVTPFEAALLLPSSGIAWLRYTYGCVASAYLFYSFSAYKDYEYLNYQMLSDIHEKLGEQSRLQEKLLGEYLAKFEMCKEVPQSNSQELSQSGESREEKVRSTSHQRPTRSSVSRSSRESTPTSSLALRPRKRISGGSERY